MNDWLKRIDDIIRNLFGGTVDYARDRASYEAASAVERATFGRVFNYIEGAVALVMIFGCFFISSATQGSFLQYVCGILWVAVFIAIGGLLARFRHSLFIRIRGVLGRFMGR